jgi:adenine-specific DNA methylase
MVDESPRSVPIDAEFDVEFADEIARRESYNKHLYRPNTYLHKWWARRCGSTFRIILKHLVADEVKRDYYAPGGLEGRVLLDPMMGGGTTLHEAIRLGASVVGVDIDPIPVLQARATLSDMPLEQLESAFAQLYGSLREELGDMFQTSCPDCGQPADLRYVLYGVLKVCECGPILSVDSTVLRYNSDGSVIRICERCHHVVKDEEPCRCAQGEAQPRIVEKGTPVCETCGARYQEDTATPFYVRYVPLAVVGECPQDGLFFVAPRPEDLARIERANARRAELDFGPPQDFAVQPGPKSGDLIRRGVTSYLDLFSSRQLLYLHRAIGLLPSLEPRARLKLALLVSTSIEFNSMLCGYKGGDKRRPGAVRHTFSHHAYSFPHTALENNPLYPGKASGTLQGLFHSRIRRANTWALNPEERRIDGKKTHKVVVRGEVDLGTEVTEFDDLLAGDRRFLLVQGSSASLDLETDVIDYVVTDPPYFDSVQYSDLATFFRVWLRKLLPVEVDWEYDLDESAVDPHANGNGQYTRVLGDIFSECHRVLKKEAGRLIFTYHHWNPKGWAALTKALQRAGFVLLNRYVVHSENPASVHILDLKALRHDAILVLAPRVSGLAGEWPLLEKVDATDSRQFCEDCATVLGWMLNERWGGTKIDDLWEALLG